MPKLSLSRAVAGATSGKQTSPLLLKGRGRVPGRFASLAELQAWLAKARQQPATWYSAAWQMRHALQAVDLARLDLLTDEGAMRAALRYPVGVPPYLLTLVDWDDPDDPIRRQWQPDGRELMRLSSDASEDPFGEHNSTSLPGLVQRFPDRLLLMVSATCAVRCRHCTRKNQLDQAPVLSPTAATLRRVADYITARPAVREVLLSGGDPLMLSDAKILRWVDFLAQLPQLDAIRIGSRIPGSLPMRITPGLAARLGASGRLWLNTHFNHPREITPESTAACRLLVEAGIPLSNQSVLLAGVNDSLEVLAELCCSLQRIRVRPYYLFLCDPVTGTLHFRTSLAAAQALEVELSRRIGGLAMPRFVADLPGMPAKTALATLAQYGKIQPS